MTTPDRFPEQPGSRPNPEFSRIAANEGMLGFQDRIEASIQAVRDVAEVGAMTVEDPTLIPDEHIDRELRIRELAADMSRKDGRPLEEAEATVRAMYEEREQELAANLRARGERDAAFLRAYGDRLVTGLQEYAGSSLTTPRAEESNRHGVFDRLRHSRLGRWMLGGTVVLAGAGAAGVAINQANEASQAEFQATQAEISPVIKDAMVDIDQQTLNEQRIHPDNVLAFPDPDGHMGVTEFRTITGNVKIIMGNTDGKPDPNKPLYVDYRNNVGREGKVGTQVLMTSPEGNAWVDEATDKGLIEFGGSTDGGWAAMTVHADTTSRGFGDSMPGALEAAQKVAATAHEQKPYDPYR